ncbi:MAG: class I SAM-dependent methyltransferase, partial [Stackebrandtia sp.]
MRPRGTVTRGTTNPNRLRRLDHWLNNTAAGRLRSQARPLVVDLGFGASPVTTLEWFRRLRRVNRGVRLVGLEIDPERVHNAQPLARAGELEFVLGGFELAGLRPLLVRAANVLRQYDESEVAEYWGLLRGALAPGGLIVDATCDELGRVATWITLDAEGPRSLTLSANLRHLDSPGTIAERLPKALIHHNVPGEGVHELIAALDAAWRDAASARVFGARDRWRRALDTVSARGWP